MPSPRVTWWEDGVLIDDSDSTLNDQRVSNTYLLRRVTRQNFGSTLTCQAINSPFLAALTVTLSVEVFRKYAWLTILCCFFCHWLSNIIFVISYDVE